MPAKSPTKKPTGPASSFAAFRAALEKEFGDDRVLAQNKLSRYEFIPTGSLALDYALRTGGLAKGRIHEIVGQPGVGKSSTAYTMMANAQKAFPDQAVVLIDLEHSFDKSWAERLGLDTSDEKFLYFSPADAEDVSDFIRRVSDGGWVSMITVDSMGAMESRAAYSKKAEESAMGKSSQVISRMIKHVTGLAAHFNVCVLLINQYRANLSSPMGGEISAGPKIMTYMTTTKIEMKRTYGDDLYIGPKSNGHLVGIETRAKVTRNKLAPGNKVATFQIINEESAEYGPVGIYAAPEILAVGILTGVIAQGGGGYYTLPNGERLRGQDTVAEYLQEHPEVFAQIRTQVLETVKHELTLDAPLTEDEEDGDE